MDATDLLKDTRLVPVVVIEDWTKAADLARALSDAGVNAIEVTLRTKDALRAIEVIASEVPEIIVGAGSVRSPVHFEQILKAGARFAVSPGATEGLLATARERGIPFVPGAETASEILRLMDRGYTLQKFFPAEQSGGLARLKALSAPLPEISFFPTGGITGEQAKDYLAQSFVQCIGGSWFIAADKLRNGDFEGIRQDVHKALTTCNDL